MRLLAWVMMPRRTSSESMPWLLHWLSQPFSWSSVPPVMLALWTSPSRTTSSGSSSLAKPTIML